MNQHYFVGVDGGASKTIVRLEDAAGQCLGEVTTGPANIQLHGLEAQATILQGFHQLLNQCHLSLSQARFYAGLGLAGCEVPTAVQALLAAPHPFTKLYVTSDAETACLGAHNGKDGAIIIAGTGMVGFKRMAQQYTRVAGWGFPHDDEGGGAWLGLQAVRVTLQWLDGRLPSSQLTQAIYAHFQQAQAQLVTWANQANATMFAELAPIVTMAASAGDITALSLLKQAARCVERIADALALGDLPLALMGGLAPSIQPHLAARWRDVLRAPQMSSQAGAILFARQQLSGYTNKNQVTSKA